jgi:hypothetical protein
VVAALLLPASANAASVSAGEVVIQPDGQTLSVTLSVTCDPGSRIFGTIATLIGRQATRCLKRRSPVSLPRARVHRLAPAAGGDRVRLHWADPVKNGKGIVTNGLLGLDTPSGFVVENYGPVDVKIRKK